MGLTLSPFDVPHPGKRWVPQPLYPAVRKQWSRRRELGDRPGLDGE